MILRLGDKSDVVRSVQLQLKSLGFYAGQIDSDYGPITARAVRAFQSAHSLKVDGVIGDRTWSVLLTTPALTRPWFPTDRCWPLRCLPDGRKPLITSGHASRNPSRPTHYGVDIFYRYQYDDPPMPIGDGGRTERWWIPRGTWCVAPWSGRVIVAGPSPTGHRVWLEHRDGWKAGFFHLDALSVQFGSAVPIGAPIGRVGDNPRARDARHLHFEIAWGELAQYPSISVDPQLCLDQAKHLAAAT
jgi:hypothetical protein